MILQILMCATLAAGLYLAPNPPPAPTRSPEFCPPQVDWSSLSNSQLIARLPRAADEYMGLVTLEESQASQEMWSRILAGEIRDHDLASAFVHCRALSSHRRWPRGMPYRIALMTPRWLNGGNYRKMVVNCDWWKKGVQVRGVPRAGDMSFLFRLSSHSSCPVALLPPETSAVTFTVHPLIRVPVDAPGPANEAPLSAKEREVSFEVSLPIEWVSTPAECMTSTPHPEFESLMRSTMRIRIDKDDQNAHQAVLTVFWSWSDQLSAQWSTHALVCEVSLLNQHTVSESALCNLREPRFPGEPCIAQISHLNLKESQDPNRVQQMKLRIVSSAETCFNDLRRDMCLTGECEIPLSEVMSQVQEQRQRK
jgi:hypothetical protein